MNDDRPTENADKLLIVDDDEAARFMLSWVFRTGPWNVTTASSGSQALQLAKQNDYQLVILDYLMPEMNGITAARELHRVCAAPILLCSAHLSERRKRDAEAEPAISRVIEKPVNPEVLRKEVDSLIHHCKEHDDHGGLQP